MKEVSELTFEQFKNFVVVLAALAALIVLIGNVVKTIREWRKPGMSEAEWRRKVDEKLDTDNQRIQTLEEGNKVICKGILALLNHSINGDSKEKLEDARTAISDYLIER